MKSPIVRASRLTNMRGTVFVPTTSGVPMGKFLADIPGVRNSRFEPGWLVPHDLMPWLAKHVKTYGAKVAKPKDRPIIKNAAWSRLRPFQQSLMHMTANERGAIAMFDTGLGKSPGAIASVDYLPRKLVVCPASLVYGWQKQVEEWSDNKEAFPVIAVSKMSAAQKRRLYDGESWIIVASSQIERFLDEFKHLSVDAIIADEAHEYKHYQSQRSRALAELTKQYESATRIALTATPVGKSMLDMHSIVNWVWPWSWGAPVRDTAYNKGFLTYYAHMVNNGYGDVVHGLDPSKTDELRSRVSHVGVQATMAEWQHLLPKLTVNLHWLPNEHASLVASNRRMSFTEIEQHFSHEKMLDAKVAGTIALADTVLNDESQTRLLVVPYHKEVKDALAKAMHKYAALGWHVTAFDGETPKRDQLIAHANAQARSIMIATMGSIEQGRNDLVAYKRVIVAEPYYISSRIVQLLGRFPRLNATPEPVIAWLVIMERSIDEAIWEICKARLSEQSKIFKQGGASIAMTAGIEDDEKNWRQDLTQMMSGWRTTSDGKFEFLDDLLYADDEDE
jgi:hypothetical protein